MQVFINVIPGSRRPVTVNPGNTVADAIALAGVSMANKELRRNSVPVQPTDLVNDGDELFVLQIVKGNDRKV